MDGSLAGDEEGQRVAVPGYPGVFKMAGKEVFAIRLKGMEEERIVKSWRTVLRAFERSDEVGGITSHAPPLSASRGRRTPPSARAIAKTRKPKPRPQRAPSPPAEPPAESRTRACVPTMPFDPTPVKATASARGSRSGKRRRLDVVAAPAQPTSDDDDDDAASYTTDTTDATHVGRAAHWKPAEDNALLLAMMELGIKPTDRIDPDKWERILAKVCVVRPRTTLRQVRRRWWFLKPTNRPKIDAERERRRTADRLFRELKRNLELLDVDPDVDSVLDFSTGDPTPFVLDGNDGDEDDEDDDDNDRIDTMLLSEFALDEGDRTTLALSAIEPSLDDAPMDDVQPVVDDEDDDNERIDTMLLSEFALDEGDHTTLALSAIEPSLDDAPMDDVQPVVDDEDILYEIAKRTDGDPEMNTHVVRNGQVTTFPDNLNDAHRYKFSNGLGFGLGTTPMRSFAFGPDRRLRRINRDARRAASMQQLVLTDYLLQRKPRPGAGSPLLESLQGTKKSAPAPCSATVLATRVSATAVDPALASCAAAQSLPAGSTATTAVATALPVSSS